MLRLRARETRSLLGNVRFGSKADVEACVRQCPLLTQSGHRATAANALLRHDRRARHGDAGLDRAGRTSRLSYLRNGCAVRSAEGWIACGCSSTRPINQTRASRRSDRRRYGSAPTHLLTKSGGGIFIPRAVPPNR